ncbi:MAG: hypothetical protein WA949_03850 [Phormidesmis sp.]
MGGVPDRAGWVSRCVTLNNYLLSPNAISITIDGTLLSAGSALVGWSVSTGGYRLSSLPVGWSMRSLLFKLRQSPHLIERLDPLT